MMRGAYEKIYLFSPSADLDSTWLPVKKYAKEKLGQDQHKEPWYFHEWSDAKLQEILDEQKAHVLDRKRRNQKDLDQICIVVDDFADSDVLQRNSNSPLTTLAPTQLKKLSISGFRALPRAQQEELATLLPDELALDDCNYLLQTLGEWQDVLELGLAGSADTVGWPLPLTRKEAVAQQKYFAKMVAKVAATPNLPELANNAPPIALPPGPYRDEDVVGKRVSIQWDDPRKPWYDGVVTKRGKAPGCHCVKYDCDGWVEEHDLAREEADGCVRWV